MVQEPSRSFRFEAAKAKNQLLHCLCIRKKISLIFKYNNQRLLINVGGEN